MLKLSEFMAGSARQGKGREKYPARSMSLGPVVVLKGWREGMDKVGVTLLLCKHGVRLADAYEATDSILQGRTVSLALPVGADVEALRQELDHLGVIT
jgi:hypothetical protein